MKVEFNVLLQDKIHTEIVEIDEGYIKGDCFMPRNKMNNLLDDWIMKKVVKSSYYRILDDKRFDDEFNNLPYVDYITSKRLGWFE